MSSLTSEDIRSPDGLAIDWVYMHVYWTDTGRDTIEVADIQSKMRKVLIKDDLEEPRAIAVNPLDGWMYWSDWGQAPKIERCGMDGSHRKTIIEDHIKWPNGLTIGKLRLYVTFWISKKKKISVFI